MHLNSVPSNIQAMSTGDPITKGQLIGYAGETGNAHDPHLHFELRIGTQCSLEYQIANPNSSCSGYGFDPHMNPMMLLSDQITAPTAVYSRVNNDLTFDIVNSISLPTLNKFEVNINDNGLTVLM